MDTHDATTPGETRTLGQVINGLREMYEGSWRRETELEKRIAALEVSKVGVVTVADMREQIHELESRVALLLTRATRGVASSFNPLDSGGRCSDPACVWHNGETASVASMRREGAGAMGPTFVLRARVNGCSLEVPQPPAPAGFRHANRFAVPKNGEWGLMAEGQAWQQHGSPLKPVGPCWILWRAEP